MAFTSWSFLVLAGLTVVLYYLAPRRFQWILLLAASMVFYLAGGFQALVWLLGVILVTWGCGLLLDRQNRRRKALPKDDKADRPKSNAEKSRSPQRPASCA